MEHARLFAYDDWANREVVSTLRAEGAPAPALRLLNHIVGAQWVWFARLRSKEPKMDVWPELTLEQVERELEELRRGWRDIWNRAIQGRSIEYRNTKGERHTSRVDDVLTHVLMHGTYHRGQIATLVRQGGSTPAYTDFIHASRSGAV
ncbi:MAG TPA: DinB family protein [Thermoanaerobaculia bacterium]|nr:DinB family protein [Thermoanaerobaculia bacterium]